MAKLTGVVVACDHFLPPPRREPSDPVDAIRYTDVRMYQYHIVVRLDGSGRHIRLRTEYGHPLRLVHLRPELASCRETDPQEFIELLEAIDEVARMFAEGNRLSLFFGEVPSGCRREDLGYHHWDVAVAPGSIERLRGSVSRPSLALIMGGGADSQAG